VHRLIDTKGRVLFVQRDSEVADILAGRQPVPAPAEEPNLGYKVIRTAAIGLAIVIVLIAMAVWFFLFGETRDRQPLRPDNTPEQLATAYRLPRE
jgi:hypothetical protein